MIEIFLFVLLIVVTLMTVGIYLKMSEQARSLAMLDKAAKDWLAMEIRRARREVEGVKFDRERALRWLTDLIGAPVDDVIHVYRDFQAVEVLLGGDGQRSALVTALPADDFRRRLKQVKGNRNRLEAQVVPMLPRRSQVFDRGLGPGWVYFDLEAQAVGEALGVDWGRPDRLWVWM